MFDMEIADEDSVNYSYYTNQLKRPDVLSELKSADNKFLFTRALLMEHGILPTKLDHPAYIVWPSITEKWKTDFEQGLSFNVAKRFKEAAKKFSSCMVGIEPGNECHTVAVISRSIALFHLQQFSQSLIDMRQGLEGNYPPQIGYSLFQHAGNLYLKMGDHGEAEKNYLESLRWLDRANLTTEQQKRFKTTIALNVQRCKSRINYGGVESDSDIESSTDESALENAMAIKLVGGRSKNIPALSSFLELKSSNNMGRGVYTTRDINPGDVVAVDQPYIYGRWNLHRSRCHNCLKSPIVSTPCTGCSFVYYCSKSCMDKSMKDGHNFECPIIFAIRSMSGKADLYELALKWFLKDVSKMGLEKYCSLVDKFSNSQVDPMTKGFNEDGQYKSDNFLAAYSLDSGEKIMSTDVLFFFNCVAAEMLQYLMLSGFKIEERYLGTVGNSLVRILSILDLNAVQININAPTEVILKDQNARKYYHAFPKAIALYPSLALFNHSCNPNIQRSGDLSTNTRVIKAIQPIPKGSQLFINYGRSFDKMTKEERQETCRNNFKFECCCQRCVENWPSYDSIPKGLSAINIIDPSMANTVIKECKLFEKFIKDVDYDNYHLHLDYLYGFIKLLFTNVKQPFELYNKCLHIIEHAHTKLEHPIVM